MKSYPIGAAMLLLAVSCRPQDEPDCSAAQEVEVTQTLTLTGSGQLHLETPPAEPGCHATFESFLALEAPTQAADPNEPQPAINIAAGAAATDGSGAGTYGPLGGFTQLEDPDTSTWYWASTPLSQGARNLGPSSVSYTLFAIVEPTETRATVVTLRITYVPAAP